MQKIQATLKPSGNVRDGFEVTLSGYQSDIFGDMPKDREYLLVMQIGMTSIFTKSEGKWKDLPIETHDEKRLIGIMAGFFNITLE